MLLFGPMFDTHCHLTHRRFADDADLVVARSREVGLRGCVTIGTGVDDGVAARGFADRHPDFVRCTAGLDPFSAHAAGPRFDEELERLESLLAGGGFVAVGEIGLDYHHDLDPRPLQAARFEKQLDLAERLDLPVVVHVREAHEDLLAILEVHPRSRGVIHSFSGGPDDAERYVELGWYLGFSGALTFRPGGPVPEAARCAPLDRLLVETDAPYLAPNPVRGRRCEPVHVVHTLARLAEIRGDDREGLAGATTRNAAELFRIPTAAI